MHIKKLRTDPEIPPFLFVAEMPFIEIHGAFGKYECDAKNPRPIPPEIIEPYRAKLADFLAAFLCEDFINRPREERE